jgi:hypothetical protein
MCATRRPKRWAPPKRERWPRIAAKTDWRFDLAPYTLLEQSQQVRATGRVDHAFVYQRPEALGEARFRVRLSVAGDDLVEIAPYVHVPESFDRRFRELRSTNDTIAGIAGISAGLLYGLGGCILGVLWLGRTHWLLARPALVAGLVVGGLMAAASLSSAPAAWFDFDTAQSATTFWSRQIGAAVAIVLGGASPTPSCSWRRRASRGARSHGSRSSGASGRPRPHRRVRCWAARRAAISSCRSSSRSSRLFYFGSNRWLGWWQPSEVLTDPNILSAAIPALMPIAISLQAGFMEECLFRAVPLALGSLIGAHFGRAASDRHRDGAAGADLRRGARQLPGLPRVFAIGRALRAVDAVGGDLPSLRPPVDDPAARALRSVAVRDPAVPCRCARRRNAARARLRGGARAAGDRPVAARAGRALERAAGVAAECGMGARCACWPPAPARSGSIMASRIQTFVQHALPWLGVAGPSGMGVVHAARGRRPALVTDRASAERAADAALQAKGITLGPEWRRFSTVRKASDEGQWTQHRFVWREEGPEAYRALVGTTLAPPLWEVRYAMFEGDVAARAEEWRVSINPDGSLRQVRHQLPEARPGARLSKEEALKRAEEHVRRASAWIPPR